MHTGTLHVISTDFQKNLSKFGTSSRVPPRALVFCGNDVTLLYWDKILLMVGPNGSFIKYSYDTALHLVTECDGVRIISDDKCEFLSKVAPSTEAIFKVGAITPAALLYDAAEAFEHKSVKADENIREIKKQKALSQAINQCVNSIQLLTVNHACVTDTDGIFPLSLFVCFWY